MRRLHPTSGVVSVAQAMFQGAFLGFFVGTALAGMGSFPLLSLPVLSLGGAALFGAYAGARYLRYRYEIDGGTLAVESGVFARQSREIPLGRIQNVDVRQGVLNRVLGLAVVEFETAGGARRRRHSTPSTCRRPSDCADSSSDTIGRPNRIARDRTGRERTRPRRPEQCRRSTPQRSCSPLAPGNC
ncbi:PH domain-containing protein [Halomicroarcula sp. GCM10025709]|uniref:PH domain-containing protein n=1 Tax=Halomicroarcula sp. GCM10025709 TaxID=3252669 RepID=UPI00360C7E91